MDHGKSPQNSPISYMHVASQLRVVGKDGVIPNLAVMRKVHIRHDPIVIA
jgi:hypothetical protein